MSFTMSSVAKEKAEATRRNDDHLLDRRVKGDDTRSSSGTRRGLDGATGPLHLSHDDQELKRRLTIGCVACTSMADENRPFIKVGAGSCGTVFSVGSGIPHVYKFANPGWLDGEMGLLNDDYAHVLIIQSFETYKLTSIKIPKHYQLLTKSHVQSLDIPNGVFLPLLHAAQAVCNLPTHALVTQRIWPQPDGTRDLLIEKYCADAAARAEARSNPDNTECLVRVYLGAASSDPDLSRPTERFSLRNFRLHLDQMLALGLDVLHMAREMAAALAIMHWAAKTDARDIEFVLGCSKVRPVHGKGRRKTEFWVLDFNQVGFMELNDTEHGVQKAVHAATQCEPYFPRPLQKTTAEREVWNAFARRYLATSDKILAGEGYGELDPVFGLPRVFLNGLIEVEKNRQNPPPVVEEKTEDVVAAALPAK